MQHNDHLLAGLVLPAGHRGDVHAGDLVRSPSVAPGGRRGAGATLAVLILPLDHLRAALAAGLTIVVRFGSALEAAV